MIDNCPDLAGGADCWPDEILDLGPSVADLVPYVATLQVLGPISVPIWQYLYRAKATCFIDRLMKFPRGR